MEKRTFLLHFLNSTFTTPLKHQRNVLSREKMEKCPNRWIIAKDLSLKRIFYLRSISQIFESSTGSVPMFFLLEMYLRRNIRVLEPSERNLDQRIKICPQVRAILLNVSTQDYLRYILHHYLSLFSRKKFWSFCNFWKDPLFSLCRPIFQRNF